MPVLRHNSSIHTRKDHATLRLQVCHSLLVGEPYNARTTQRDRTFYDLKKPLPASVDVFSHSNLTIIVSATMNGHRLTSETMRRSVMTRHFVKMLRENVSTLRINNVSNAYIDEFDCQVKVDVTPQRSVPPESSSSQVALISIHLTYHCKTMKDDLDGTPVSLESSSNTELLNQAVDRLITYHMAKRYPHIFGPWGEKLDQEKLYFPSIAHSLFSMARRSPNDVFRRQFQRYLKILRRRITAFELEATSDLDKCCSQILDHFNASNEEAITRHSDENAIGDSMQRLFKVVLRPSLVRCKHVTEDNVAETTSDSSTESLLCEGPDNGRVDPFPILNDDDSDFDAIQDEDDLICNSELEDISTPRSEKNWTFMSRPRLGAEAIINPTCENQSSGDAFEGQILDVHGALVCAKKTRASAPNSESSYQDATSEALIKHHTQAYSDFSDSDSDSLSLSFLEENYSPILCSADEDSDSNITNTNTSTSRRTPNAYETLPSSTQLDQGGHKETTSTCIASADRSCWQAFSSTTSIVPQSPLRRFLNADREFVFDCNVFLPPARSPTNENLSSFASVSPAFAVDYALHSSAAYLPHSCPQSDSVPMVDLLPSSISFADDKGTSAQSLGLVDEAVDGFDLCNVWGAKMEEGPSSSAPLHFQGLPLFSNVTHCSTHSEEAMKSGESERMESGSPELRYGVFDFAGRFGSESLLDDDGELDIDGDDSFDDIASSRLLQYCGSGRLGEKAVVEMIVDSEDEEGESRWSLFA